LAWLSVRVFRSDSACALPRPSATASAKLANSTVNHSHTMIWKVKPRFFAARHQIAQEDDRRQRGDHLNHEHHGALDHDPRIEFCQRRTDGRHYDLRVEHRRHRVSASAISWLPWT